MLQTISWATGVSAITHPIALCAYVLTLVFALLARKWGGKRETKKDRRLFSLFASLAILVIIGGLLLALWQSSQALPQPQGVTGAQVPNQVTSGPQSPNVQAGEDVTIQYGTNPSAQAPENEEKR